MLETTEMAIPEDPERELVSPVRRNETTFLPSIKKQNTLSPQVSGTSLGSTLLSTRLNNSPTRKLKGLHKFENIMLKKAGYVPPPPKPVLPAIKTTNLDFTLGNKKKSDLSVLEVDSSDASISFSDDQSEEEKEQKKPLTRVETFAPSLIEVEKDK